MKSFNNHRLLLLLTSSLVASAACVAGPDTARESAGEESVGARGEALVAYNSDYTLACPLLMDMRTTQGALPGLGLHTSMVIQNTSSSSASVRLKAAPKAGAG